MAATNNRHTDTAELLINAGAYVDTADNNGMAALMFAAGNGHADTTESIIGAGADVNAKTNNGNTALSITKQRNASDIIRLLEKAKAQ